MYVKKLILKNFRNYENQTIEFSDGTNIICGNNANGKTNILEAIYLFGYGKSARTKNDTEMIRFENPISTVSMSFECGSRNYEAVMKLSRNGKKAIMINNVPVKKLSRLISYLKVVLFSPDDLSIVKGSPSVRRHYMDAAICRMYPKYLSSLSDFQKSSKEKNELLKALRKSGKRRDDYLSVWNERIAELCSEIMAYRQSFTKDISRLAFDVQKNISSEELKVEYEPSLKCFSKEEIYKFLEDNQSSEIEYGQMKYGVQRDDISLMIGELDSRKFASQGQQRTVALSLKIAEADYIFEKSGEYPVLLLDDIFSELDMNRRMYLWEKIENKQVIITCTDTDFFENKENSRLFYVNGNTITNSKLAKG